MDEEGSTEKVSVFDEWPFLLQGPFERRSQLGGADAALADDDDRPEADLQTCAEGASESHFVDQHR